MSPPLAGAARVRAGSAVPAPLRLPPAPRRVSGPDRHPRAAERTAPRASSFFVALIDHPWLERLIRGRAWIAIVATALLGIVAMQVELLRLGAQIGTATANVNSLTQRELAMQGTIGEIEAGSALGGAGSLGMLFPPPGAVTYLQANPGDAQRAIDVMTSPSAAALTAAAVRISHAKVAVTSSATTHNPVTSSTGLSATVGGATVNTVGAANTTTPPPATTTGTPTTTATTGTASSNTTSPPSTGTSTTAPGTTAAGGTAATTTAGGTNALSSGGADSGASVAPGATSSGG